MAEGKDIAWKQWGYVTGALMAGIVLGTVVIAPMWEKSKAKNAAKKGATMKASSARTSSGSGR